MFYLPNNWLDQIIPSSLTVCENELERIAEEQGSNVSTLVDLVKENENILDTMKVRCVVSIIDLIQLS